MYDLAIIGGGINGAGIARDAAGRGLKVLLCEKDDLAAHTSSASTKLIHGGLRYLEHYDFKLVRKALIEREVLLKAAPHIIWPMRFVLPQNSHQRSSWLVRLGLFIYDHLGGRKLLPGTKVLDRKSSRKLDSLSVNYQKALEYSDCWVDDARLVVLNAVDAAERGATIMTRTECIAAQSEGGAWSLTLKQASGLEQVVAAKQIVNAAGPWVDQVAELGSGEADQGARVRCVKGSHIITNKKIEGEDAFFFQNADGRVLFAIPYLDGEYTLFGTTDVVFQGDPQYVQISAEEIDYICESANMYLQQKILPEDVISSYSGVRPLYDDKSKNASKVTRDYVLSKLDNDGALMISVYGGKITTYRKLAEDVLALLLEKSGRAEDVWTANASLPGGDIASADFEAFFQQSARNYAWADRSWLRRLCRAYGTRVTQILGSARSYSDLGRHFGSGLYWAEVSYLIDKEFAQTAEDILYRRTKLHMKFGSDHTQRLDQSLIQKSAA